MVHFGSSLRIFLNFCTRKRAKRYMKFTLMAFTKKKLFRANGPFWTQKWHLPNSGSVIRLFFKFCTIRGAMVGATYIKILLFFDKKIYLEQFDLFRIDWLIDWALSKLSKGTVTIRSFNSQDKIFFIITNGSLNSQNMIRTPKQSGHNFSTKYLCDEYCMDIMWCSCVEVKIQKRFIWFCKASLRMSLAIFFDCRGLEC